ncbi:class I SAM-dependent methyltransferase [Thiorhodospira sibirica]|uniref:class I SAM-dependent methyltransferase n=1 Tax=Thiorhodospira sibirica TaxID=154347 RepID=UPI00022C0B59|nr:class I SAM-dependent methyltransferase [Thiorhodospira sibirica]
MATTLMADYEVREEFCSLDEWRTWHPQHPEISSLEVRTAVLEAIRAEGYHDPVSDGRADPTRIEIGTDLREGILYCGLNSRMRAVWVEMLRIQTAAEIPDQELRVFAPEALTDFALRLRGKYRFFLGSEYMPTAAERNAFFPIQHQDLQKLTFPDGSFHVIVCNEVFEHVPDIDASLGELCRVLKPGGALVGTFPFCFHDQESLIRARLRPDGSVEHLTAPEYHGNPVDPESGALVFEIPGWNILDRANRSGFKRARMVLVGSRQSGVLAEAINGVMIMVAER